jgi:ribonuclease III
MADFAVIFRTNSEVEARIVRGLLDSHGVRSMLSSEMPHSVFPLTVHGLAILVREDEADEAARIINSHKTELASGQVVRLRDEFADLETALQYRFRDRGLLEHALTHTSRANEDVSGGVVDNESLEFLGDAVLGFAVADMLFEQFPGYDEGQKSKLKAELVSTSTLARLADQLRLGDHLLLGRGEEKTGGRRKEAIIADCYEALIAAIYLDGGIEPARAFIERQFAQLLVDMKRPDFFMGDFKSALQEHLQSRSLPLPEYHIAGEVGPDHRKLFQVEVRVRGEAISEAAGRSKKEAEQKAARLALEKLRTGEVKMKNAK